MKAEGTAREGMVLQIRVENVVFRQGFPLRAN